MRTRVVVVVLILAGIALLLLRGQPMKPGPSEVTGTVPPSSAQAPSSETKLTVTTDDPSVRAPVPVGGVELNATATARPNLRSGRLIVVDQDGVSHEDADADILFQWSTEDEEGERKVPVVRGRWELDVGHWVTMRPKAVLVAGRHAVVDQPDDEWECQDIGDGLITVHVPKPVVLHVRDAASKTALGDVTIVTGTTRWTGEAEVPRATPSADRFERSGESPFTITYDDFDGDRPHATIHARAEGYAWGCVRVRLDRGGPYYLDLERPCSLDVVLVGKDPSAPTTLMISTTEGNRLVYEDAIGERDRITIEDVAPGKYHVSVLISPSGPGIGHETIEVKRGDRGSVTVNCRPLPTTKPGRLSGIVAIPKEWNLDDFALRVQASSTMPTPGAKLFTARMDEVSIAKSDMHPVPGRSDAYSWTLDDVSVGGYRLSIEEPPMARMVSIGPGDAAECEMIASLPTMVSVVPVDERTGSIVRLPLIGWCPDAPNAAMALRDVKWSDEAEAFVFRAPIGRIMVHTLSDELPFDPTVISVDVVRGMDPVRLKLRQQYLFGVTVRDAGEVVEFPRGWSIEVRSMKDEPVESSSGRDKGNQKRIAVYTTGTFRVVLKGDNAMFELPLPRVVTVGVGNDEVVGIDLQPKH